MIQKEVSIVYAVSDERIEEVISIRDELTKRVVVDFFNVETGCNATAIKPSFITNRIVRGTKIAVLQLDNYHYQVVAILEYPRNIETECNLLTGSPFPLVYSSTAQNIDEPGIFCFNAGGGFSSEIIAMIAGTNAVTVNGSVDKISVRSRTIELASFETTSLAEADQQTGSLPTTPSRVSLRLTEKEGFLYKFGPLVGPAALSSVYLKMGGMLGNEYVDLVIAPGGTVPTAQIRVKGTGEIEIKTQGRSQVKIDTTGNITISTIGSIKLSSVGEVSLESVAGVKISSTASLSLTAPSISINNTEFLTLFNSHFHISPNGPTSTPVMTLVPGIVPIQVEPVVVELPTDAVTRLI